MTRTGTMRERAAAALRRTWSAIGPDTLQCIRDEDGRRYATAEEVRESVSTCGFGRGEFPDVYGGDREATDWLAAQPYAVQDEVLAEAFPRGRYGM